jgi:hypothetical protein
MKCDVCGEDVGLDAVVDTHSHGKFRGDQVVPFTICRRCLNSRRATQRVILWVVGCLIGGGVLIAIWRAVS